MVEMSDVTNAHSFTEGSGANLTNGSARFLASSHSKNAEQLFS
jgi:hypothetical protein